MPSYKFHTVFAAILALIYIVNPIYILLAVIGANIPDFDHKIKEKNVYRIVACGIAIAIGLYFLKLPFYLGVIIIFLAIIFYFSNHRGFTHSLIGIAILSILIFVAFIAGYYLIDSLNFFTPNARSIFAIAVILIFLTFLFINKRIILPILGLFFAGLMLFPIFEINLITAFIFIIMGVLSHIALDSFTPAGIKLLKPHSSKIFRKKFGIGVSFIIILLAIPFILNFLNIIKLPFSL
ncbi:metal-dependent hydrolase [Methanobrevibacter filiformis]|uniref:Inner membrane protein n=1 Tax=Methanobrevibacter filiformis TaxID=55758 RepID=A0A166C057_9EURY|nr:metal-dependent hydrolase [Methanobrevibacter filiformis]KZX13992.1 inner membrane protein [Methanobrevibacter filiformis]